MLEIEIMEAPSKVSHETVAGKYSDVRLSFAGGHFRMFVYRDEADAIVGDEAGKLAGQFRKLADAIEAGRAFDSSEE